ncbi:DUF2637 domain-containing protein [Thermomonospora cellulosilytica]|uniref:DUF2637 domain-containing protein n=1 Tax=Thermomonospora cellulosilytica TaxID=1411118 RepID=A0A7W3MUA6_9ACTN|nr:DUF2637 domain-containing protein [Thermomonospora cellulosilytica]MBA9001989.1 hypothetical protein [Thermomonospora cellulosilytica]
MSAGDRAIRALAAATVVGIGGIAAVISYRHALGVAQAHGETGVTAYLTPLTIDGLVFVASMVMLDSARRRQQSPALARLALALGIGATVAVNVLHGLEHGPVGAVIAAWPAVTLVVVVELLMGMIRRGRTVPSKAPADPAPAVDEDAPEPVPAGYELWESMPPADPAWWPLPKITTPPRPADEAPVPAAPEPVPAAVPEPDTHQRQAAEVFADEIAAGRVPSIRAIRRALRVGQPRAQQVRAYLAVLAEHGTVPAAQ